MGFDASAGAAAAEAGKGAGEAAAAADVGAGAATAADIGAGAATAADIGAGAATAADVGAGAGALADVGAGAGVAATDAATAAGAAGVDAGISGGLAGSGALAGSTAAGAAADAIPEVTVTGTAPAAGAGITGSAIPAAGIGAGVAGLGGGSGGGGSAAPTAQSQLDQTGAGGDVGNFLPATNSSDLSSLSPDVASSLGIDTTAPSIASGGGSAFDASAADVASSLQNFTPDMTDLSAGADQTVSPNLGGSNWLDYFTNPKNDLQLGMLGVSGLEALLKPKLPGAANTALNAAGPAVQQAQAVISSGGTATPVWQQQKASIDASINQQEQQLTEQILQNAANAGEGNQNSGVVQQQVQQMKANLEDQRQQLYLQAQQQNVSTAVSELTGGNQTLSAIANMQLAQEQAARQAATQTAQLAMQLSQLEFPGG